MGIQTQASGSTGQPPWPVSCCLRFRWKSWAWNPARGYTTAQEEATACAWDGGDQGLGAAPAAQLGTPEAAVGRAGCRSAVGGQSSLQGEHLP